MKFTPYRRTVFYYETDQMGIVHHANYIRWFEEARMAAMEQMGLSYVEMEAGNVLVPVLSVSSEYRQPVCYGDTVDIFVELEYFDGIRMMFSYRIKQAQTGELCNTGTSSHCFFDREHKLIHLKKKCPEWYQKIKEAQN